MTDDTTFPSPAVVEAVMRHMNDDHTDDSLVICRGLGGRPEATAAHMTGMDADGIDFAAETPGGPVSVRVPFGARLTERPQVRDAVVRLYDEACRALGLEPRTAETH